MSQIEVIVYGMPGAQGSKRFVGTSKAGRGIMIESSAKVKPWRADVKAAAELVRDANASRMPLDGPLCVSMMFTLPKPASAPKKRRTWPDRKPDVSKLARSTEDALTDAGFWADDARVVTYWTLGKCFPGEHTLSLPSPGVRISVWRLDMVADAPRAVRAQAELID